MAGFRDDGSGDFQTCLFEPVPVGEAGPTWPPYGHHMSGVTECSGIITGTTDSAHSNLVGEDASEHIYNFTISAPGTYTFDGCDSGYDLWLRIMSLDLETEYAGCDDCGCLGDSNRAALRDVFLGEGEYVLVVEGARSRHGEYHINVEPALCVSELVDDECHDDKGGFLLAQGHTCESVLDLQVFNCQSDLRSANPTAPDDTLLSLVCPDHCETACEDETACDNCQTCEAIERQGRCHTPQGLTCCDSCPHAAQNVTNEYCTFGLGRVPDGSRTLVGQTSSAAECAALVAQQEPGAIGAMMRISTSPHALAECHAVFDMSEKRFNFWWQICELASACADDDAFIVAATEGQIDSCATVASAGYCDAVPDPAICCVSCGGGVEEEYSLHHCSSIESVSSMQWLVSRNG